MPTPIESLGLFVAAELPKRPYTNTFPFAAGKTLITTGVGLEVVAGDAPGEFLDSIFRIKDNVDETKQIAFQASGIGAGTSKTITMPNSNVDLGRVRYAYNVSTGTFPTSGQMVGLDIGMAVDIYATGSFTLDVDQILIGVGGSSVTIINKTTTNSTNTAITVTPISGFGSFIQDERGTIITSFTLRAGDSATMHTNGVGVVFRKSDRFSTDNFFIGDSTTPSKRLKFDASVIVGPADRTIIMSNADANLGDLPSVATTNTNNLTNTTARILGGSGGTASKPNATIITGASCTANGGLSVVLTGNNVATTLGGAVIQGGYQSAYENQAAVKQSVMIVGQTTANVLTELTNCGSGGGVTTFGDTKYILATKPNGMSNTNGVGIHRITLTGSNQTTGATYFGFSGEYIVTCSYNGTTTVIDAITTVHTSLRAGVAETFTPSFTLDVTTANAALLIGVTTTLGNVRCAGHVESVYS